MGSVRCGWELFLLALFRLSFVTRADVGQQDSGAQHSTAQHRTSCAGSLARGLVARTLRIHNSQFTSRLHLPSCIAGVDNEGRNSANKQRESEREVCKVCCFGSGLSKALKEMRICMLCYKVLEHR